MYSEFLWRWKYDEEQEIGRSFFIEKNLPLYSVQLYAVATESICTLCSFVEGDIRN